MRLSAFAFGLLLALSGAAKAQGQGAPPSPTGAASLCNSCTATLSVGTSSSNIALPAAYPPYTALTIKNSGPVDAYFSQGSSTVTANLSNDLIRSGRSITVFVMGNYLAAITPSGSTTLDLYQANAAVLLQDVNPTVSATIGTVNQGTPGSVNNGWWSQLVASISSTPTALTGTSMGGSNALDVNVVQSALPSGASTAASQSTANSYLSLIESNTTATKPNTNTGAYSGATVGLSASTVVASAGCKVFCEVENNSATATICLNTNGAATGPTNGQCPAGEITLIPYGTKKWDGTFIPADAISAISNIASTPVTIGAK